MARALLFQLDGKLPNIALMRLAAHHRALGDEVELRRAGNEAAVCRQLGDDHDHVYASLIFESTRPVADRLLKEVPRAVIGGTGWPSTQTLEDIGVTTLEQDYGLYPRFRPSIGFTQRGCRLRCPFCVVPTKEGKIRDEQTIADVWRGEGHPRDLVLLDNDFFGAPGWRARLDEIRAGGFRVNFTQGINARVIDDEVAEAIASVDYRTTDFKTRRIYTAWDNAKDEVRLFRGLELLRAAGVLPNHIMVYMLIGYWAGETHEDRDYRRAKLREFGARPYPMPYRRTHELIGFQRWVLGGYDKSVPWGDWMAAKAEPRRLRLRGTDQVRLPLLV